MLSIFLLTLRECCEAIAFLIASPRPIPSHRSRPITISPMRCCCAWAFLNQPELRSSGCEQQVTPLIELYTSSNPNWTPNPNCNLTPFRLNWCTAHLQLTSTLIDWILTRWNSFQNVFSLSSKISSKAKKYKSLFSITLTWLITANIHLITKLWAISWNVNHLTWNWCRRYKITLPDKEMLIKFKYVARAVWQIEYW